MQSSKKVAVACVVGISITALTAVAAVFLRNRGFEHTADVMFWPSALTQAAAPCVPITATLCEGTPLNIPAFMLALFIGIAAYSAVAYIVIHRQSRRAT